MENFMPKGLSEVKLGPDWGVVEITAIDDNIKIPFRVIGGKLKKLSTPCFVPNDRFREINKQVRATHADYEKRAELARELKKPNWAFDLQKYGVIIEPDGSLKISRWMIRKSGERERVWQKVKNINSAIRMQDHIVEERLEKKNGMENGSEIPPEFSELLKRLSIVLPHIEMRRELLIFAQEQMDLSSRRTAKGLKLLLAAKGMDWEKCHGLPEKLTRLSFFLKNNWPNPYREKVDQIVPLIKEAKKSAAKSQWKKTESLLTDAEKILSASAEVLSRQSLLVNISELDPIRILAEVDKYGLADQVMAIAKRVLPEPYYIKSRGLFRLNALLAVSQLVITGESISQEEILKLCR